MLDFPIEIKELFMRDNISAVTHKNLKLVFYRNKTQVLYPRENLYPDETLYPAERNMEEDLLMVIENNQIEAESLVITESLSETENLDFGSCNSSMLEIVVADIENDLIDKEFELIVEIGGHEVLLGTYTVKSFVRQADRTKRKITAYDRMKWFDEDVSGWYETERFPMTLKQFRNSLCAFVGIQEEEAELVNDDMVVEKTIDTESLFGIDALKCICQINGVFGNISKEGKMRYISVPKKNDFQGTIKTYKVVEYEEYNVPDIDTVKIQKEEGDIGGTSTGGDDVNTYIIEGNFLVYGKTTSQMIEIANNILSNISELEYRPATIETSGSPWYEIGDRLRAITSDGDVNTIITRRTLKGIQKMMDTFKSTGSSEIRRVFNIRSQITEAKGMTAILKRTVEEVSNELTNFESQTNSKFSQTAEQIAAEVTRAISEEEKLSARIQVNAEAIALRVTSAQAESLIEQKADSIRLKANAISWSSANSSMTADGTLNCVNGHFSGIVNALNGGTIGGFKINGNNLESQSSGTTIQFGKFYINGDEMDIANVIVDQDAIYIGYNGSSDVGKWETDTGDIYVHEIYPTDNQSFWKGWGVLETVEELWNYTHGGGWSPCPSDSGCDGGGCDSCGGDCNYDELECDIHGCGSDGGCSCDSNSCDGCSYSCDNLEGPGC